jgi:hypothetical protein
MQRNTLKLGWAWFVWIETLRKKLELAVKIKALGL